MNWGSPDDIDRTAKILIEAGKATSPDDARRQLEAMVLQVDVGPEVEHDEAAQAALATVVNVGHRAFRGGVHVRLDADPALTTGWTAGMPASEVVARFGGEVVHHLADDRPTLVIGQSGGTVGNPALRLAWNGWTGGVVQVASNPPHGNGIIPAGILAAAVGVSETFQQQVGAVVPGRRDVGISLWRPDLDWCSDDAIGPPMQYLPAALWLLGLGHLGQAYAWTLGMLPYATPCDAQFALMDFDLVVQGNASTQLLVRSGDVGQRKTRIVAAALEGLGFKTRVVERAFDNYFRPVAHANAERNEPGVALAGFDDIEPRQMLSRSGFARVVDAGLGTGHVEYLDMVLHTFPAPDDSVAAFVKAPSRPRALGEVYETEIARQVETGVDATAAHCGVLDIAGITVGAAFVGTFASALVVADILRVLHGGDSYSVMAIDLRDPAGIKAVPNRKPGAEVFPAFSRARPPLIDGAR